MANGHYSPDSGPSSHLSVAIVGNRSIAPDAALPGVANTVAPGLASVAGFISTIATSHN